MHTEWNPTVRRSQPLRKLHLPWNTDRATGFVWSLVLQVLYLRRGKSVCGCQSLGVPFTEDKICPKARLDRLHGTYEQGPKKCFHSSLANRHSKYSSSALSCPNGRNLFLDLSLRRARHRKPWLHFRSFRSRQG